VARAKRTERTDARRRYREEQAPLTGEEGASETTSETTSKPTASNPSNSKSSTSKSATDGARPAGQRQGFMTLMKAAYRPPRVIDDLKSLPLVVTNIGFIGASLGSIAIAVWFCLSYNTPISAVPIGDTAGLQAVSASYQIPAMLMGMVISPPPAVGAFLIGFMAKRASWLGGLLYGILCTIIVILVLQQPAGRLFTADGSPDAIIASTAAWAPIGAALFAAAAAWYKRFLNLSNPNRARAEQEKKKTTGKPSGRGDVKPNHRSTSPR
jgi:hypothetical protein